MQINTIGTMRVNAAVFDLIFKSRGVYVNIASVAGRIAGPGLSTYNTSKFAVAGYSSAMRRELAPYGIRVVCVEPGFAKTPLLDIAINEQSDMSQTRLGDLTFAGAGDPAKTFEEWGGATM
jgi:NAD(P)-dependent dehydrogenase (short-subunit alcohol dehydrogenase family)